MSINQFIGTGIREQREKLGLKQHDIAHALQVSPQAVSKWERGENAPDIALLVPLSKVLGISVDTLLGYHQEHPDVFDATVFLSMVVDYPKKANTLPPKAVAAWANGFFFQLTEALLHFDGIPVKYLGDKFLCFFAGPNHQRRAIQAAFHAEQIVSEPLTVALSSGAIYLGAIGHPEYSRPDIMGDTVNLAFIALDWASQQAPDEILATASVLSPSTEHIHAELCETLHFQGMTEPFDVYRLSSRSETSS